MICPSLLIAGNNTNQFLIRLKNAYFIRMETIVKLKYGV